MTMSSKEFEQLKKLLTLATSENDHEALSAWRAATALVARSGYTWTMLMERRVTVVEQVESLDDNQDEEIQSAFDTLLKSASGRWRETVLSIQNDYHVKGFLTPGQKRLILNAG